MTRSPRLAALAALAAPLAAASLGAALLAAAPAPAAAAPAARPNVLLLDAAPNATPNATPNAAPNAARPAAARQDPADSLYRAARALLSDGAYDRAADAFRDVAARYPRSRQAPDALYYEAFARYRAGGTRNLHSALAALDAQRQRYAGGAGYGGAVSRDDAAALAARIRGALARAGDADAAEAVASGGARAAGAGCPAGGDDDERTAALSALAQLGGDQALAALQRVLARRDACSAPLRRKAVFLLSQQRGPETADALLRVAQSDPDREVREQAVFWLSQVRSERATELLVGIVNGAGDAGLKEKAVYALGQQQSERGTQALRELAAREGADAELREKAIFWLGQQHRRGGDNTAFLRGLYSRLTNADLKERVLFSLSQQRGEGNGDWLLGVAENAREPLELRKKALFWAAQGGASLAQLGALYGRTSDRELREQLVFAYSQRREPEAVDRLMDVARRDADPELRKRAIFWLGQSRDPRAAQFLASLLDR